MYVEGLQIIFLMLKLVIKTSNVILFFLLTELYPLTVCNSVSLGVEFYAANTKTGRHKYLKFFTACVVKYYLPRCHLFKITFKSYTFWGERWHFDYGKEQIILALLKVTFMKGCCCWGWINTDLFSYIELLEITVWVYYFQYFNKYKLPFVFINKKCYFCKFLREEKK